MCVHPKSKKARKGIRSLHSWPSSGPFHSQKTLLQTSAKITSIVRHLARAKSGALHWWRRWRFLTSRRWRWWWCLLPCGPVLSIGRLRLRPARRSSIAVPIAVACVAHFTICVFKYVRSVAAVFRLRGAQVEAHVGNLRGIRWHAAQWAHVGRCARAISERSWAFEAGL